MWLGVDDTDSVRGGCTTFVLTELVRSARDAGLDVLGEPRLVRLNPNVPWKTRGNAALGVRLGHGQGTRRLLGEVDGRRLCAYRRGRPPTPAERDAFAATAWEVVRKTSRRGEDGVDPALVITDRPLPAALYWRAVREVVPLDEAESLLRGLGAEVRTDGSRRGIVGAAAALAWPARRVTWELLAYRRPDRLLAARRVAAASVVAVQREFPELFLCADGRTRRILVTPHTRCPILFGLRSRRRPVLPRAARKVRSETVDRWLIFRTNQGTGDHLGEGPSAAVAPYSSGRLRGRVRGPPERLPGGHVRFQLVAATARPVDCVAFEPTKTLPAVARRLAPGDRLEVWGGRSADPTFRLEGIRLLGHGAPAVRPPRCPACGRSTHSMGTGRGFRCEACRTRVPPELGTALRRSDPLPLGTYHPTPSARRHLAPQGPEVPWRARPGTDL